MRLGTDRESLRQKMSKAQVRRVSGRKHLPYVAMYPNDPGGFTEKGMKVYLQQTAPRLGVDPDKIAISQIADMSFLREVQRQMEIQCRDGYGC